MDKWGFQTTNQLKADSPNLLKRYWFLLGLLLVFAVTVADSTNTASSLGQWLKVHRGLDAAIILIFFSSGMLLDARQIRAGLQDYTGTLVALAVIFIVAPLAAAVISLLPLPAGIIIGIILVAAMPTTLSSGVVMSGAAGGSMAHALFVTILANTLAVFLIPVSLSLLLLVIGGETSVIIDKTGIMFKLGGFVLLPLASGLLIKHSVNTLSRRAARFLPIFNQCLILITIWMGLSQTRQAINISGGDMIGLIILLAIFFHALLLAAAGGLSWGFGLGRGRRESVIFMGAQKTLPLSIILQVALFPQFGLALVFCVVHHIVHLLMDSYLVGRLRN
jgi:sodium/bile acid cotransporter 7